MEKLCISMIFTHGKSCNKLWLTMKLTTLLLLISVGQMLAVGVYSQKAKVSIKVESSSIEDVLDKIEKQTAYLFFYNKKEIDTEKRVTLSVTNQSVSDVLSTIFNGTNVNYNMVSDYIVLTKSKDTKELIKKLQQKTVTGMVTDANTGSTLAGVSIMVEGTSTGVISDTTGRYSIVVPDDNAVLVFTYISYLSEKIVVAGKSTINVSMVPDVKALGEVVVTALGIKKDYKSLTYDVQKIDGKEVTSVTDANFVNSLSGKIAGVTINSSSTGVGGSSRVVMRGTKSLAGNNNALYVVDGIPLPSLQSDQPADAFSGAGQTGDGISNFNPDDIESISVLSGPAAAALYGREAANGVLMVTTKKGQKGLSINVSNSTTFSSPFVLPKFQNTYGVSDIGSYYSWGDKLLTPSSYNPKDFFQTGYSTNNSLSVSTGSDKNATYFSIGSVNAEGIIHNNNYDRYNLSFQNTSKFLNDKLTVDVSAMYINVKEQNMLAQGQYFNPLIPVYLFPAGDDIAKYKVFERYNPDRNFKTQYWPFGDLGFQMQNPYWITERDLFINNKNRYMMTGTVKYTITNWMNITARAKLDVNTEANDKKYSASTSGLFADVEGAYYKYNISNKRIYADAILNINKTFNKLSLTANIGSSLQDEVNHSSSIGGNLMSVANLFTYENLNTSTLKIIQQDYHDQFQAVFATAQLGYKSMAFIEGSVRTDWTSALANTKTKSILYPSVGASAVLSDILGIKSDILSFLKARASYSEVGNSPVRFISNTTYPVINGYPQLTSYLPATGLEPERTKSYEAGFNFIFFNNKIKLDATFYKSSTYNQLFNPSLSASSGYNSMYINAGRVDNKGIELTLNVDQKLGPVDWNSSLVYSLNRNKIIALLNAYTAPDGETVKKDTLDESSTGSYLMKMVNGGTMGDIYVNTLKQDEHGYISVNTTDYSVSADINRFVKAGSSDPNYTLGFRNSFSFKGINLSVLINARVGGVGVSVTQAVMDAFGVSKASADARDNGGVVVNGYKIPAQAYYQVVGGGTSGIGSMYVYSATNVRLAELSLGYDIPVNKFCKWVKGINVSFIGRNLFMFYNKAPFDPESTANTGTYYQGIDYFMQPSLRSLGFACRFRF
ncbi:MAG TPA: SusC/RagA family TonB-linked outer membrane protein [Bacteroidales bacterium]